MLLKKKMCAGYDGNEHEDYIYKNIGGQKYCKTCTHKLQPQKPISKISKKNSKDVEVLKFKIKLKQDQHQKDKQFYNEIWNSRFKTSEHGFVFQPSCENCTQKLGYEPNLMYFHHLLEKRNYPQFRYLVENIMILCTNCHGGCETAPHLEKFSFIAMKTKLLKEKLLNN